MPPYAMKSTTIPEGAARWIGGELELARRWAWRWRSRAASARRHHLSRRASRRRLLRYRPRRRAPHSPARPRRRRISGLSFAGTFAYKRNVVEGPHLLFTMPASGGDGMQLVEGDAEQARWSADGARLSVVGESPGAHLRRLRGSRWLQLRTSRQPDPTLQLGCGACRETKRRSHATGGTNRRRVVTGCTPWRRTAAV